MRILMSFAAAAAILLSPVGAAHAQQAVNGSNYVINLRDADIADLAERVSVITGRTIVLDPGVEGTVTVFSTESLDPEGVWALFQAALRVQGFVMVGSGDLWRIVPEADARAGSALDTGGVSGQDFATRIVNLQFLGADAAAAALRPLIDPAGALQPLASSNAIVVTDTADNIARIESLAQQLDRDRAGGLQSFALSFGRAADIAASIQTVTAAQATGGGRPAPLIALDPRSNVLVARGTPGQLAEIRRLVRDLDRPSVSPDEQFTAIPLEFADAVETAEAIRAIIGDRPATAGGGEAAAPALRGTEPRISADRRSNTLLVRADPQTTAEIRSLAQRLDQPTARAGTQLATIPLRFGDAATVAAALEAVLAGAAESEGAPRGAEPPRVSFDARSNSLLVRADARTLDEIRAIAARLDGEQADDLAVIPLRYADADDLVASLEQVAVDPAAPAGQAPLRLSADARGNAILVRGSPERIRRIRDLAAQLDQPGASRSQPVTRVYRLRHADAEPLAEILREIVGLDRVGNNPVARSLRREPQTAAARLTPLALGAEPLEGEGLSGEETVAATLAAADGRALRDLRQDAAPPPIAIRPATDLNALVLRGEPAAVAQIVTLIEQLDQRRPQVLIEAAIVEISGSAGEQLGIQFGFGDAAPDDLGIAGTSFSNAGVSLGTILTVLGIPEAGLIGQGLTLGGSIGDDFSILLQALATSSKANLLSTPSLTTLDNEEAEIVVGQNVPFRTGSFTIDGNSTDPFTTIQREDVGITLRVAPRINEGDVVRLAVAQEVSSLVDTNVLGAADLITNRRSIETTVLADDGETIVLGGLITDDQLAAESKVPLLGDIPVAGRLFRSDSVNRTKRTLFVFLRPTILRNRTAVSQVSQSKYERLRQSEGERFNSGDLLLTPPLPQFIRLTPEIDGLY